MSTFQELGLRNEILSAVEALGFEQAMPIQEKVIPFMLEKPNDLVALAQTGTGKTAAFGLPILNQIDGSRKEIQALILAPTRELCIQIANDVKSFAAKMPSVKIVPVFGGESIVNQFRQLDVQPQILVATPGRLIDLINRGKVHLDHVSYLVLDEADEMLSMGFQDDLETILQSVPDKRRTLLFSATMPKSIEQIAKKYMGDFTEISVGARNAGSDNVEHVYYVVQAANRYLALKRIVDMNPDIYGIVFCRTRQETKDVADKLMRDGYNADALHGDLSQAQRDTVMNKFRIRNLQILVATDVAARGLDVSDLTHVINYNLPDDVEIYTHRSGRTGRAGKKGVSVSIIHTRERRRIREIERSVKKEFTQLPVPSGMDICKKQLFNLVDKMENVDINAEEIAPFMPEVYKKLDYLDKEDILNRFVSLEFNRFLDYYKDAVDLNVTEKFKSDRGKDGQSFRRGQKYRMKINIGSKQKANPRSVLGLINDITNDKSISIGNIEITNKFTFFDIFADQADQMMEAFQESGRGLELIVVGEVEKRGRGGSSRKGNSIYGGDDRRATKRYDKKYDDGNRNDRSRRSNSGDGDKPWRRRR